MCRRSISPMARFRADWTASSGDVWRSRASSDSSLRAIWRLRSKPSRTIEAPELSPRSPVRYGPMMPKPSRRRHDGVPVDGCRGCLPRRLRPRSCSYGSAYRVARPVKPASCASRSSCLRMRRHTWSSAQAWPLHPTARSSSTSPRPRTGRSSICAAWMIRSHGRFQGRRARSSPFSRRTRPGSAFFRSAVKRARVSRGARSRSCR